MSVELVLSASDCDKAVLSNSIDLVQIVDLPCLVLPLFRHHFLGAGYQILQIHVRQGKVVENHISRRQLSEPRQECQERFIQFIITAQVSRSPMSKRILCKFFAHGACLKGEHCEFSHDWKDPTNNICTFYQRGICSYGSRCRYEHVKASRPHPSASSSSRSSPASASNPLTCAFLPGVSDRDLSPIPSSCLKPMWNLDSLHQDSVDEVNTFNPGTVKPEEQPICSYAAAGDCPRGDECPHIHGNICPTCGKCCLHPFRPEEREEHKKVCEKKQKQLEALKLSQEVECCVCLERVLSKPTPAERKFGLLTECDHAFCIACIRNWRSSSPSTGMDVNSTLRACPICRKLSYFVVPSVIWFSAPEEKKEIMDSYREKLRSIDCKHFNFGDGNCPFGTSCFYKHAYHDGRLEEVVLRHLDAEDGQTVIAKDIRLSDFLENMHI